MPEDAAGTAGRRGRRARGRRAADPGLPGRSRVGPGSAADGGAAAAR